MIYNIIITGLISTYSTQTVDFDPDEVGVAELTGSAIEFVAKYNSNSEYIWAGTTGAGNFSLHITDLAIDDLNNIYSCGYFVGDNDFDLAKVL